MNPHFVTIVVAATMFVGCATSAPETQKPKVAPAAEKVGTKSSGAAPCDRSQAWGHFGSDPDVRKALDAHFEQRPGDEISSFHVLSTPRPEYPKASPQNPVVTYRFTRNDEVLVERALVSRTDGGGWQVTSIAWTCVPTEA